MLRLVQDHRADAQGAASQVCKVHWIFTFACAAYNLAVHAESGRRSFGRVSRGL